MKKIAIIGASMGQLPLCLKAKEMGLYVISFAWEQGAACKDVVDKFYPISILEKDRIVEICRAEHVDGVISNASDITALVCAYVAEQLSLNTTSYSAMLDIENKYNVREKTQHIDGLSHVFCHLYSEQKQHTYPCVVKPCIGSAKKGVSFVNNEDELAHAIQYAGDGDVLIEQYIAGREISVESISYKGKHYVVQVTDKESSGVPHFVELAHHQPADLSRDVRRKIEIVVPQILNKVGFSDGATHIEMKIDNHNNLYLIEINPRGGGDKISSHLVKLSTGYDYLKGIIQIAIGEFLPPQMLLSKFSGIYFLCAQTIERKAYFDSTETYPWLVKMEYVPSKLVEEATGNYNRSGYIIYQSDKKINL